MQFRGKLRNSGFARSRIHALTLWTCWWEWEGERVNKIEIERSDRESELGISTFACLRFAFPREGASRTEWERERGNEIEGESEWEREKLAKFVGPKQESNNPYIRTRGERARETLRKRVSESLGLVSGVNREREREGHGISREAGHEWTRLSLPQLCRWQPGIGIASASLDSQAAVAAERRANAALGIGRFAR